MNTIGCPLEKAKAMEINEKLWREMEDLAKENPAEPTPIVWGEKENFIVETYYAVATNRAITHMLSKVSPDINWTIDMVRGRGRRMGLKKGV